ncbi:hypothetical protein BBJ28_00009432 [Nothophytophthora sp. Chile5]|nr:hypothetical protein BBJ28_00009432 [Nothophytophthora sp. Chile5]
MKILAVLALALAYVATLAIAADPPTDAGVVNEAAPMKDDGEGTEAATTEAMGRDQEADHENDVAHTGAANGEALEYGWGGGRGYGWGGGRGYYGGGGYGGRGYGYGGGGFRHGWRS